MGSSKIGLLVILAKLGPKLVPLLLKLQEVAVTTIKSLFGIKAVGIVGSVGLYTYLFTWQMAVALVVFIGIHEYGHLWAMQQSGIKTRGMYFLPGFGAVAIADEGFKSARNEAYIALMGPIFGITLFVFPCIVMYLQTGDALWAAIAAITCFVNLINLLPINPLDGGRVVKALAYSKDYASSLLITIGVSFVTLIIGVSLGFSLLWLMALIGFYEVVQLFGIQKRVRFLMNSIVRLGGAVFLFYSLMFLHKQVVDGSWLSAAFVSLLAIVYLVLGWHDFRTLRKRFAFLGVGYFAATFIELRLGIRQLRKLKRQHIKPIANYDVLQRQGKMWYAALFVLLIAVHVVTIYFLGLVPGAELASEMLK